jgi:hypothetical protein
MSARPIHSKYLRQFLGVIYMTPDGVPETLLETIGCLIMIVVVSLITALVVVFLAT